MISSLSRRRPGAMLLLTVLVLGSVALAIVLSMALRGIGEMGMAQGEARSEEAFAAADACVEEGLLRLALSTSFTGATLSIQGTTCTVSITPSSGNRRTVAAAATRDRWTRRASARVDLSGSRLSVLWWKQDSQ